jgi:hypothetical protein
LPLEGRRPTLASPSATGDSDKQGQKNIQMVGVALQWMMTRGLKVQRSDHQDMFSYHLELGTPLPHEPLLLG